MQECSPQIPFSGALDLAAAMADRGAVLGLAPSPIRRHWPLRVSPSMQDWVVELREGRPEEAWSRFLDGYRRLIFAAIRHYAQDHDDVMDVFAEVCASLRSDQMRRLRERADDPAPRAQFSTWLVAIVRHQTVDWFRHREGRRRLSIAAESLPPLQRTIFGLVFLDQRSHTEAYEAIRARHAPDLSFREFLVELRATYQAVSEGHRGRVLREMARVPPPPPSPAIASTPAGEVEAAERQELLSRALDSLSADDRAAVQLYVMEELPAEQVAKLLALPNAKAVYNRAYRAVALLRQWLQESGIRPGDL